MVKMRKGSCFGAVVTGKKSYVVTLIKEKKKMPSLRSDTKNSFDCRE